MRARTTLPRLVTAWIAASTLAAGAAAGQAREGDAGAFYTAADGTRIHYEVEGEGRPVVLVHGFTGDGAGWKSSPLYRRLLDAGMRVVTLDLRGNGRSDHPHTLEAYQDDAEARDVMGLARALGLGKYCVVGYSRGSIITARLLVLDEDVRCAVLGGMGADFTNPEWPRRVMFYHALLGEPVPELEGMIRSIEQRGLDRQALAYQQGAQPSTSPRELAQVERPVLVISGDADHDNGSASELAALLPASVLETVPGDHGSTMRSERFGDAVVRFLRAH